MRRAFRTFIGVDLGGGKGKTTAVARLRVPPPTAESPQPRVVVDDYGGDRPWFDERLIAYLLRHADEAVVAIDAPLTLTACVRCAAAVCPGAAACQVPVLRWFAARRAARVPREEPGSKPAYTPYTQRATEVFLAEEYGILPRETLGQGMGPLTARAAHLRRALAGGYRLNENLLEVYPKATLAQLFPDSEPPMTTSQGGGVTPLLGQGAVAITYRDSNGAQRVIDTGRSSGSASPGAGGPGRRPQGPSQIARHYKRSGHAIPVREEILRQLSDLSFGPGQWREFALQSDHQLDAVICAYTAYLWARDGWELPPDPVFKEDGWIWFPPVAGRSPA